MEKAEVIKQIFEYAKMRIEESSLRDVDKTTSLFCDLLEELGEVKLAEELDKFYAELWGEEEEDNTGVSFSNDKEIRAAFEAGDIVKAQRMILDNLNTEQQKRE